MQKNPPRFMLRLFRWFCHPDIRVPVEGDLMELYDERCETRGKRRADLGFIRDVILLIRPGIIRPAEGTHSLNIYGMIKNYFKTGIRNILKHKVFSFINIFGLAIAMTVSLFIILMIADQSSHDRFHPMRDRIYRVLSSRNDGGPANASSPLPLASYTLQNYPAIASATTLIPKVGGDLVYQTEENRENTEIRGFFADKNFFDVLGFELSAGDKSTALSQPNSIIITADIAYKLFDEGNPIGRNVRFIDRGLGLIKIDLGSMKEGVPQDFGIFEVTGVIDTKKYKSHISFDALISSSSLPALYEAGLLKDDSENWLAYSRGYTYLLAEAHTGPENISTLLQEVAKTQYADIEGLENLELISQPLTDISPGKFVGNPISLRLPIEVYYLLSALALIIILSACLNYTNLSIARMTNRTREIGIRKVNGATRLHLTLQFLTESLITSFLALATAILLIWLLQPLAGNLWISNILKFDLSASLPVLLTFLAFTFLVALIAGLYPALVVSRYNPVNILKNLVVAGKGKTGLRKLINVTQLGFSLFFIITSIVLARQFASYTEYDYGFNADNIVNIPLQGNDYQLLVNEFKAIPGVHEVSASEFVLALLYRHGASIARTADSEHINAENISVSPNFTLNIGVGLIAGEDLLPSGHGFDKVLVNEKAVSALGFSAASDAIGKTVFVNGRKEASVITGVIRDFNFETPFMGEGEMPLILYHQPDVFSYLNVKVASANYNSTLAAISEKWADIDPLHPVKFYNYSEQLANSSKWFGDLTIIIGSITVLAVVISCLGLLGMVVYSTELRTREIGIRKMLGATKQQLMLLLGRSYLKLLFLAIIIFAPLSYLFNNAWLENIPNRVTPGGGTILIGILILAVLSFLTIFSQLLKASGKNPTETIKNE